MREWNLGAGDPLFLSISADARLSRPDYSNDPTWELIQEGEDPPALTLQTTFGLRASWLRLFPRFTRAGQDVTNPAEFARPPHLTRFFSNLLTITLSPFNGIDVRMDYWVPNSSTLAGRIRVTNTSVLPEIIGLELAGMLSPLGDGESLAPVLMGTHHMLKGRTDGLSLLLSLAGAPQPVSSPYPALALTLELAPGNLRELTWALATHADVDTAADLAHGATSAAWEAETARIELQHLHHYVDISSGNPDWDAAFAFTQMAAYRLFFPNSAALPAPSFVLSRRIDQGYSPRGDGSDYAYNWNGQTVLDAWYLSSLILPAAPELVAGLVDNFLAVQEENGEIDWKPGLAGQRGRYLAQPLLAALAWRGSQIHADQAWLGAVFPRLLAFFRAWLNPAHDRDSDGFPEWDHPLQTGFEHNPLFDRWHADAQGADITTIESPALGAYLYNECQCLIRIAQQTAQTESVPWLQAQAARLRQNVGECWDAAAATYRVRDFATHRSDGAEAVATVQGSRQAPCNIVFTGARRLLLRILCADENTRATVITIRGHTETGEQIETVQPVQVAWARGHGRATSSQVYLSVEQIETQGFQPADWLEVTTVDFQQEALSLLLPLWAGIPDPDRAQRMIAETLPRYRGRVGYSMCPPGANTGTHPSLASIFIIWNQFIGEALLAQGQREQAAALVTDLMDAIVSTLKQERAFRQYYHAVSGQPLGESNSLAGLAPLGLFMQIVGIDLLTPDQIIIRGTNPFPRPITVQYRGMTILRDKEHTTVTYPDGQSISVAGPGPYRFSRS